MSFVATYVFFLILRKSKVLVSVRSRQKEGKEGKFNSRCIPEFLCMFLTSKLLPEKLGLSRQDGFFLFPLVLCIAP